MKSYYSKLETCRSKQRNVDGFNSSPSRPASAETFCWHFTPYMLISSQKRIWSSTSSKLGNNNRNKWREMIQTWKKRIFNMRSTKKNYDDMLHLRKRVSRSGTRNWMSTSTPCLAIFLNAKIPVNFDKKTWSASTSACKNRAPHTNSSFLNPKAELQT